LWDKFKLQYEAELAAKIPFPIKITLPDGKIVEGQSWRTTPYEVAKGIRYAKHLMFLTFFVYMHSLQSGFVTHNLFQSKSFTHVYLASILQPFSCTYCGMSMKTRIVQLEEMSLARLWHSKYHVCVATVMHATIEKLWEAVFSVMATPRLYLENRNRC
jgi:hypothetical protein